MSDIDLVPVNKADRERLQKLYSFFFAEGQSFIRTSPGNCLLPAVYEKYKDRIRNLKLRDDDVFVLTWSKTGTTWTQEMLWCILNDLDFEKGKASPSMKRVPYLEFICLTDMCTGNIPDFFIQDSVTLVEEWPSPRVIKSHLPYCLLPDGILDRCRIVTCLRNPKDTLVSFYHHDKFLKVIGFEGSFDEYFDLFMEDLVVYDSYWVHTLEAWKRRDHPNLCLLFFEDMKSDQEECIRKVCRFLQKDLTEAQVKSLADYLNFDNMKKNHSVHEKMLVGTVFKEKTNLEKTFFRRGKVGDWKNYFTEEMNKRMDERIEKCFGGTGLEFRYE